MTVSTRPRAPRKDAVLNREAILDAAANLLNQDPDSSLEAIAQQAGLSRRAFYGHFSTRDELLGELLVRGAARLTAALEPVHHPDPRVEIALYGARSWAQIENVRILALLAVRGPHRDVVARTLEPVRRHLSDIVERGIATGVLRPDIEAGALARLIEGAALNVLDEATRTFLGSERGHRLVMLTTLAVAGLGWEQATELIDHEPVLAYGAELADERREPAWLRA